MMRLIMMCLVQTTSSKAFESDPSFVTLKNAVTATVTIDLKHRIMQKKPQT